MNLKIKLMLLHKTQADVIREINNQGIKVSVSEFSRFINGVCPTPKCDLVLAQAEKIVQEWEEQQNA